jgi:hypothetical protein
MQRLRRVAYAAHQLGGLLASRESAGGFAARSLTPLSDGRRQKGGQRCPQLRACAISNIGLRTWKSLCTPGDAATSDTSILRWPPSVAELEHADEALRSLVEHEQQRAAEPPPSMSTEKPSKKRRRWQAATTTQELAAQAVRSPPARVLDPREVEHGIPYNLELSIHVSVRVCLMSSTCCDGCRRRRSWLMHTLVTCVL